MEINNNNNEQLLQNSSKKHIFLSNEDISNIRKKLQEIKNKHIHNRSNSELSKENQKEFNLSNFKVNTILKDNKLKEVFKMLELNAPSLSVQKFLYNANVNKLNNRTNSKTAFCDLYTDFKNNNPFSNHNTLTRSTNIKRSYLNSSLDSIKAFNKSNQVKKTNDYNNKNSQIRDALNFKYVTKNFLPKSIAQTFINKSKKLNCNKSCYNKDFNKKIVNQSMKHLSKYTDNSFYKTNLSLFNDKLNKVINYSNNRDKNINKYKIK